VKFHLDEWIMRRNDLEAHVSHEIERNEDCVLFPGNPIKKKKKRRKKQIRLYILKRSTVVVLNLNKKFVIHNLI
jgi:hypothetical protein